DAFGAQLLVTLSGHFRIWIFKRRNNAGNAGTDNRVGARRGFSLVRARLKRHIHGGALGCLFGAPERFDFGVRPAALLGPASTKNDAVLDDHCADCRVRPGMTKIAPPERKCEPHVALVIQIGLGTRRRVSVHFFPLADGRPSSSPDNSSSAARKSLASRKLR